MMSPHAARDSFEAEGTSRGRGPWRRPTTVLLWLAGLILLAGCASTVPVSGLRPEYPKALQNVFNSEVVFVKVDSLQPTLRWETFHGPRNVTYDLKIWRAEDDLPSKLVYARQGLPEPFHTIEEPLEPSTKYFWTVRARFKLDGQPRVTQWGASTHSYLGTISARERSQIPDPFHYRFKTPSR